VTERRTDDAAARDVGDTRAMIKIVLVEDQALLRAGIRSILETRDGMRVVGEAGDGAEGVEVVLRTHPDVVLMDVRMPGVDGIEATRRLMAAGTGARIVMLTTFDHDEYVIQALEAGAAGFLLKDAAPDRLADAVRVVAAGDSLLAPAITRRLIETHVRQATARSELLGRFAALTEREREIARHLARGLSNADIGAELYLSEATVKTHVTRLLSKLGLRSRAQAIVLAYESGFVRPGDAEGAA
jgi:DNA-binding NarL/FixJ family response regulator